MAWNLESLRLASVPTSARYPSTSLATVLTGMSSAEGASTRCPSSVISGDAANADALVIMNCSSIRCALSTS